MGLLRAWTPYTLVGVLLVITRLRSLPLMELLQSWTIRIPEIFGTDISASFQPLFLPGTVFIVASLSAFFIHRMSFTAYRQAWTYSLKMTGLASIALVFTVPMVQVFINSNGGTAGYDRMPIALADGVAAMAGGAWPIFSTFIGGLGSFVAGSNTVSNMMFSLFQFGVGERISVDPSWIVALQVVGGAAGNMICVHNVVAASAVVGLVGKEGAIIRLTLIPFTYYALLPGALGYAIVWSSQKGFVNAGTIIVGLIALFAVYFVTTQLRKQPD